MHFVQLANYDVKGLFEKAAKFMFCEWNVHYEFFQKRRHSSHQENIMKQGKFRASAAYFECHFVHWTELDS